jgi:hypothetical protein
MLTTHTIPQADVLWNVMKVLDAVRQGATTPDVVGQYLGAYGPRQGAYYLRAAWSLGLIEYGSWFADIILTRQGRVMVDADHKRRRQILRRLLQQREPTASILVVLRSSDGLTRSEIAHLLQTLAPLSASTAGRRARTVVGWLRAVDLAIWTDGRLQATRPHSASYPLHTRAA